MTRTQYKDARLPYRVKAAQGTIRRVGPAVLRNGPCPCQSGKKFKRCCGAPPIPTGAAA